MFKVSSCFLVSSMLRQQVRPEWLTFELCAMDNYSTAPTASSMISAELAKTRAKISELISLGNFERHAILLPRSCYLRSGAMKPPIFNESSSIMNPETHQCRTGISTQVVNNFTPVPIPPSFSSFKAVPVMHPLAESKSVPVKSIAAKNGTSTDTGAQPTPLPQTNSSVLPDHVLVNIPCHQGTVAEVLQICITAFSEKGTHVALCDFTASQRNFVFSDGFKNKSLYSKKEAIAIAFLY